MATVEEWQKAQNQGINLTQQQKNYTSSLSQSQADWAKQYYNQLQQGNRNPSELNRYLGYTRVVPEAMELGKTTLDGWGGTDITGAQKEWYRRYSDAIRQGTNNLSQLDQYKGYANILFGGQMATPDESYMKHLSIGALNGDHGTTNYLKAMGLQALSGTKLWEGMDEATIKGLTGNAKDTYMKDNPFSQVSKDYDRQIYDQYSEHIRNGWQLDDNQQAIYQNIIDKWNLEDVNDPYVRQREQLEKDKKAATEAQDVALNQGLAAMDANSFQQTQALQQQMAERGMGDSGIAADTYMRAQMANNQNYQQAFGQAATNKADIQAQFNNAISGSRINQQAYQDKVSGEIANQNIKLQEIQSNQDKWMTESTGTLYINGRQILGTNGQPITTVEWAKLSETQRHNMMTEALTGQKNAWDYELGKESNQNQAQKNLWDYQLGAEGNAIDREKIAADLQTNMAKINLDYAKLDFNYAKLEADNAYRTDRIAILSEGLQSDADKAQLQALGKQATDLSNQIVAYQKNGQKPPQNLVDQYNSVNNAISDLVGGATFSSGSSGSASTGGGGVGGTTTFSGKVTQGKSENYNGNYNKYGKQPSGFDKELTQAIQMGVPFSAAKQLTELIGRESDWRSSVKNPSSSATGYGQFLKSTVEQYQKKMGLNYSNPVHQIVMTYQYAVDRYGSVSNALVHWDKKKWY